MTKHRNRQHGKIKVPVGLEKVLFHAAQDEEFREQLFDDREQAIAESLIRLRPSEQAILKVIPDASLEVMIAGIVPENPRRRKFMGLVATAAASLAAGTAATGCDDDADTYNPGLMDGGGCLGDDDCDWGGDADTDADTDTDTIQDAGCDADDCVDTDPPGLMDSGGDRPDDEVDGR